MYNKKGRIMKDAKDIKDAKMLTKLRVQKMLKIMLHTVAYYLSPT
jgi:hypothetical protein